MLIAARAFKAGEIVLREPPTLFWEVTKVGDLISGFLALSPDEQKEILEMASPDVESDLDKVPDSRVRERARAARHTRQAARHTLALELAQEYEGSPRLLELIESLLALGDSNAHAFQSDSVGLFPLAALANHSCDPSCAHTTSVANEMRFYATRPIATGDEITISYLPNLCSTPGKDRETPWHSSSSGARCLTADNCRACAAARLPPASPARRRSRSACKGVAAAQRRLVVRFVPGELTDADMAAHRPRPTPRQGETLRTHRSGRLGHRPRRAGSPTDDTLGPLSVALGRSSWQDVSPD